MVKKILREKFILSNKYNPQKVIDIFAKYTNYKYINSINTIQMRQHKLGSTLIDAFMYRFGYSEPSATKTTCTGHINKIHEVVTSFDRQTFDTKENHLDHKVYLSLFTDLFEHMSSIFSDNIKNSLDDNKNISDMKIAIFDGTYNRDHERKLLMNLCVLDMKNAVPIYFTSNNKQNSEIRSATDIIKENLFYLKNENYVLIFDRGYYSRSFFNFLNNNGIPFIIRCKDKCNKDTYDNKKFRFVEKNIEFMCQISTPKKDKDYYKITKSNKILIITNIKNELSDDLLLQMYENRWEIELFFKLLKSNFKFSNMNQHNTTANKKTYLCNFIITLLVSYFKKIIIDMYKVSSPKNINTSNLIKGFFKEDLIKFFFNASSNIDNNTEEIINFCKSYSSLTNNAKNRHFLRVSKTPFTKWYVAKFSLNASYKKIINAFLKKDLSDLNSNEKSKYNNIKSVDIIPKDM